MTNLNKSMLSKHDTVDDDYGYLTISFCVPWGSNFVEAVTLLVQDGRYRLGGSACTPSAEHVMAFADAWGRCRQFIAANCLEPGWPTSGA